MKKTKLVVIGAGNMAHVRISALLKLRQVEICGVAAKHSESAKKFAQTYNIDYATTDYRTLLSLQPDAVLVQLPHNIQDDVVQWALNNQLHILIGGCLASNSQIGEKITQLADKNQLIVECGYEARYKPCWHYVKKLLDNNAIGSLCFINAVALWPAPEHSWYTQQAASGGMPITHMTYAFLNPLRWLFGEPLELSAMSNRISPTSSGYVNEQSCVTNFRFANQLIVSLTAGYVAVPTTNHWQLDIMSTNGLIQVYPGDLDSGQVVVHQGGSVHHEKFVDLDNAFDAQAQAFVSAIRHLNGGNKASSLVCANPPVDSLKDIQLAEDIVRSATKHKTIIL